METDKPAFSLYHNIENFQISYIKLFCSQQPEPEFRPPMSEVVQALVRLVQRANMSKRMLVGEGHDSARQSDDTETQDYMF